MKKVFSGVILLLLMSMLLIGCGRESKEEINVYNWGDYIDESILEDFEKETGIKVNYETFATNEEMYAKIKAGGTSYDVLIPSDYMIEKMMKEDMLHKVDLSKIPNYDNIEPQFKNLVFDPNNEYSVPYFWGTVGIIYNTETISEDIDSWNCLWEEQYKGRFTMIDSQRDSLMVALKKLGYSMNTRSVEELTEAADLLIEQKDLVLAYVGDNVKDMLIAGEADMAVVWSGEAGNVIAEYPKFKYILPKEGSNIWYDNIVIPNTSKNVDGAHAFINFLCRGDIGYRNAQEVGYATCNKETQKMLDASLFPTTYAYPKPEWITGYEIFREPGDFLVEYDKLWTKIKGE